MAASQVPAGLRWSSSVDDKTGLVKHPGQVVFVTSAVNDRGEPKKPTLRKISGAVSKWNTPANKGGPKETDTVWLIDPQNPAFRIAGTEANVRAALRYAKVSDADINRLLERAVTYRNYQQRQQWIDAEKYADKQVELDKKARSQSQFSLLNFLTFKNFSTESVAIKGEGAKKQPSSPKKSGGKPGGRAKSLRERLDDLKPDHVLNVSNYTAAKDYKAVSQKRPTGSRTKLIIPAGGPQGLASNNREGYLNALRQLDANPEVTYAQALRAFDPSSPAPAQTTSLPAGAIPSQPQFPATAQVPVPAFTARSPTAAGGVPLMPRLV
jgi:hypothetical protein